MTYSQMYVIEPYIQYYLPNVNGLGPREKPKEGVFINSKLESVDIFLGESDPDPDSCRLSCEEILRCNVPEFIVDESFGDEFGAGLGDPKGEKQNTYLIGVMLDPVLQGVLEQRGNLSQNYCMLLRGIALISF